jgi:hypothetical protein
MRGLSSFIIPLKYWAFFTQLMQWSGYDCKVFSHISCNRSKDQERSLICLGVFGLGQSWTVLTLQVGNTTMQMHYHGHLIKFAYVITREIQKRRVDLNALEQVRVLSGPVLIPSSETTPSKKLNISLKRKKKLKY